MVKLGVTAPLYLFIFLAGNNYVPLFCLLPFFVFLIVLGAVTPVTEWGLGVRGGRPDNDL